MIEALCHLFADASTLVMEFMLSVDGTLTIRCRCSSVGESVGWQRHTQLKGIYNLGNVQRSKAVSCSEAPSNTPNSSVLSVSLNFLLATRLFAGLRSANGNASVLQLYQKRSLHLLLRVGWRVSLQVCGDEQSAEV